MALPGSQRPPKPALRRPRPPARLRTKTGCLTCRGRRKKCDERQPLCVACDRNRLQCTWGDREPGEAVLVPNLDHRSPDTRFIARYFPPSPHVSIVPRVCQSDPVPDNVEMPHTSLASTPTSYSQLTDSPRSLSRSVEGEVIDDYDTEKFALALPSQQLARLNLAAYGLKSSQEADLLRHVSQNVFPTLVSSHAHPGFWEHGTWLPNSLNSRPLIDALLAVSSLHLSNTSTYYDERAVGYYSNSLHNLRQQVRESSMDGSEDHLLLNVVWLYIFEIWAMRLDRRTGAAVHLKGALQILKIRQAAGQVTLNGRIKATDRLVAESCLYHLVNIVLWDPGLASLQMIETRKILEPLLSSSPYPNHSLLANSPVLAGPWEIYFTVLEVSQLSHCTPLSTEDQIRGWQLMIVLSNAKTEENAMPIEALEGDTKMTYDTAHLWLLAAKTLLFQLLNPATDHTFPIIQSYASDSMSILRTGVMGQPCKQVFCWPLLILSLIMDDPEDIIFLRNELQIAWEISSCGNLLVVLQVLEAINRRRAGGEDVNSLEFLKSLQGNTSVSMMDGIDDRAFEMI